MCNWLARSSAVCLLLTCSVATAQEAGQLATGAAAPGASSEWTFAATIYGWLPTLGGKIGYPVGSGSADVQVDPNQILDALQFTFMGMLEANKGRWGLATDVIYMDLGGSDKNVKSFDVGNQSLPASVTAKANMNLSGWLWTIGGTYRVVEDASHPVELLAGARMVNMDTSLKWHLDGDISGVPLPGRDGKASVSDTIWDAIVGFKGRFLLGADQKWFVPYYVDVGTGDSNLTWQAIAGVGYRFGWGDVVAAWRYMDYNLPSGDAIQDLWMSGAAIGATFHF